MSESFYLQDSRSCTGNNVMFWRTGGCGYGTNLDELEVYTLSEAQHQHSERESDVPLLKSLVDEKSILAVDCQCLPAPFTVDDNDEYVIQRTGFWNGNDILFLGRLGRSYNYKDAKVFSRGEADAFWHDRDMYSVFSKTSIDNISRRTFQACNIDKRKMITKPGIKLVKPKRARPTTGKTRGNCPECGKLTWSYNPYENGYCAEHSHRSAELYNC